MSHVRLACIARNEAEALPELAEHVRSLIDSWVICLDPRTTDDTERVAYEVFEGIPGRVVMSKLDDDTFNFAAARNELMDLAKPRNKGEWYRTYLLMVDCDSPCVGTLPAELTAPCYVCDLRDQNGWAWKMPFLVRADTVGEWHMPAHEYVDINCKSEEIEYLTDIYVKRQGAGTNEARLRWTIDVLTKELESGGADAARACFFLANTYHSLGDNEKATELYLRRVGMEGMAEETFFSMYRAGRLLQPTNVMKAARAYMDAWSLRPHRAEPLFYLAEISNVLGDHHMALMFANQALTLAPAADAQFVERWIEEWGIRFQWCVAAYNIGVPESVDVMKDLLASHANIPDDYREALRMLIDSPTRELTYETATAGIQIGEGTISASEAVFLSGLVRDRGPVKVGETGFGRGRSAWAFLSANPEATMVSFDIGEHPGAFDAKRVIDQHFPGRHELILGNSQKTVPEHPCDFDLVFIDGGHDYDSAMADLQNFAAPGRVIVFDDVLERVDWAVGCLTAWKEATGPDGFVDQEEIFSDGAGHRWALGRYR